MPTYYYYYYLKVLKGGMEGKDFFYFQNILLFVLDFCSRSVV